MKTQANNYAFIDSQNLNLGVLALGWKLDFKKFRVYLEDKYGVSKAFIFIGYIEGNQLLYTALQKFGYIVIFKPTLTYEKDGETHTKGNVDADLVLHTMIEYQNYSKAIIVSGDGDFHCLIEYLQDNDKLLKVIAPNWNRYSSLLRKFIKNMVFMNLLREKLQYTKKPI